jgi:hypothetical protein
MQAGISDFFRNKQVLKPVKIKVISLALNTQHPATIIFQQKL